MGNRRYSGERPRGLDELRGPEHFCFLCESQQEQEAVAASFFRTGTGKRGIFLTTPEARSALQNTRGAVEDPLPLILVPPQGAVGPAIVTDMLSGALSSLRVEGHEVGRILVDVSAVCGTNPRPADIAEYECRIGRLIGDLPLLVCCAYRREHFPSRLIKQAIYSHPLLLHRDHLFRNGRPIPPDRYLQSDPEAGEIDSLIDALQDQAAMDRERELMVELLRLTNTGSEVGEFMRVLTAFLRNWSGCRMVGIRLVSGGDFPYSEAQGLDDGILSNENLLCREAFTLAPDRTPQMEADCLCIEVLRGTAPSFQPYFTAAGSFWTNSLREFRELQAERRCSTVNRCLVQGYESLALIPLRLGKETFGLLQFCDLQPGCFTRPLILLLERIAGSVSVALAQRRAERKLRRSEEALRLSESRYRTIMEMANSPIFIADASTGLLLEANRKALEMLGCTLEEVRRMHQSDLHPPDEREAAQASFARFTLQQSGFADHLTLYTRSGKRVPVEISATTIIVGSQRLVLGIFRDVTERRRMEGELRSALFEAESSRDEIETILRSVGDGLLVIDNRDAILRMNAEAERLLGFTFREALDHSSDGWISNLGNGEGVRKLLREPLTGALPVEFEISRQEAASPRILQARVSVLQRREGGGGGRVILLRDVTRERDLDRMKSDFISTAAHELRTPLTAILGYSELLLDHDSEERFDGIERREFLEEIYDKGESLARIVGELLDISRIEGGQPIPLEKTPCRLAELVSRVVYRYRTLSPRHTFELDLCENRPEEFLLDRGKMVQVLENLLSNAVKYSAPGTCISIDGTLGDGCYRLTVSDQGKGMTSDQVERIFDKFYRADASHTAVGGLGLGMSIARHIVEAHGGGIRVRKIGRASCRERV